MLPVFEAGLREGCFVTDACVVYEQMNGSMDRDHLA